MEQSKFLDILDITMNNMVNFEHVLNNACTYSNVSTLNKLKIKRHKEWLIMKHTQLQQLVTYDMKSAITTLNTINYIIEICIRDLVHDNLIARLHITACV